MHVLEGEANFLLTLERTPLFHDENGSRFRISLEEDMFLPAHSSPTLTSPTSCSTGAHAAHKASRPEI